MARTCIWAVVGEGRGGIISQLFYGLRSTPGENGLATIWAVRLIADCVLAHLIDFYSALGINGKLVDLV